MGLQRESAVSFCRQATEAPATGEKWLVVPGAKAQGRGLQGGADSPLRDGSRESGSLPGRGCNAETVASDAKGSMPAAADIIPCMIGRQQDGRIGIGMP